MKRIILVGALLSCLSLPSCVVEEAQAQKTIPLTRVHEIAPTTVWSSEGMGATATLLSVGPTVMRPTTYYAGSKVIALLIPLADPKREVLYQILSDAKVFVSVTIDGKDAWPGGHYLNEDELKLYNSNNREILDKKFADFATALQEKSKPVVQPTVLVEQKIVVDANIEAKAIEKQAVIDAAKPEEDKQ